MNEIFGFSFFNSKRFLKSSLSNNLASAVPTTTISNVSLGLSIKARKDELKKLQEKKFNQKFKPIIDIFKKYQNKITDEEIAKW